MRIGFAFFAVGDGLVFQTVGTEIGHMIPMKTYFCDTGASPVLHVFFSVPCQRNKVNPTMHENILKGFFNFSAIFPLSPT